MLVSLALRNDARVSAKTRTRLKSLAREMGYQRDPMVTRLMNHLRTQRASRLKAPIYGLTTRSPATDSNLKAIAEGAKTRAEELGYSFDLLSLSEEHQGARGSLQRILRARGAQGILLLPMAKIGPFTRIADWSDFSVVSASLSITAPLTHRVVTNYFDNVLCICAALTAAGFRRIGLVTTHEHDSRVGFRLTAALAWHNSYGGTGHVPPLLLDRTPDALPAWYDCHRPDVLVVHAPAMVEEVRRRLPEAVRECIAFASASTRHFEGGNDLAGIDERPGELGKAAIDLLAGLIQNGDRGLPQQHRVTMVEGVFISGPSLLPATGARKRSSPKRRPPPAQK